MPVGPLRVLVAVLLVEATALVVLGVGYAVLSVTGSPENLLGAELAAAFAVVAGGVTGLLARAVSAGRSWARTPAVLINLLALPVAVGLLQGGVWAVGVPLLLVVLIALALFVAAPVRAALRESD